MFQLYKGLSHIWAYFQLIYGGQSVEHKYLVDDPEVEWRPKGRTVYKLLFLLYMKIMHIWKTIFLRLII